MRVVLAVAFLAALAALAADYARQPTKLQHRLQNEQAEMRWYMRELAEQIEQMEIEVREIERTLEGIR